MLAIKGQHHYLWRAADQEGQTLNVLGQRRRDRQATKTQIMPSVEHRQHQELTNWAEVLHQPTWQRERPEAQIPIAEPGPTLFIGTWPYQLNLI